MAQAINIAGVPLANARIRFDNDGIYIKDAKLEIVGSSIQVKGWVKSASDFNLVGQSKLRISALAFKIDSDVTFSNDGIMVQGALDFLGNNLAMSGSINTNGAL